jgi:twitching motility protein PilU
MKLSDYLKIMVERKASDIYLSVGAPVNIRIEGVSTPVDDLTLNAESVRNIAYGLMNEQQRQSFEENLEMDLAASFDGIGRFRVNIFRQRGHIALVIRYITSEIPSIRELNLPMQLQELVMEPRGLILVVGTTGSGKSTALASMIDYRNNHKTGHILTIEDPVEFLHQHRKSIVNQREVGIDTHTYSHALLRAMREAPDVILIGEIRDRETMEQAIAYADTGHLCLSTLHAANAVQTIERIINFYPDSAHNQVYADLALNLRAVVGLRLIPGLDGKRKPAVEIMKGTTFIQEMIQKHEISSIPEAVANGAQHGMQSFDQSLRSLYTRKQISLEDALAHADSRNDLSLKIRFANEVQEGDNMDDVKLFGEEIKTD